MSNYDSRGDTIEHKQRVKDLLDYCAEELERRGDVHDDSKLEEPEKSLFDEYTPKLAACTYGSAQYHAYFEGLKTALDHHYRHNSHHPEHYENGINGMDLFDLIEMFMDWKAASERHDDGDIYVSIEKNAKRFGISGQLVQILYNTVNNMGWNK